MNQFDRHRKMLADIKEYNKTLGLTEYFYSYTYKDGNRTLTAHWNKGFKTKPSIERATKHIQKQTIYPVLTVIER